MVFCGDFEDSSCCCFAHIFCWMLSSDWLMNFLRCVICFSVNYEVVSARSVNFVPCYFANLFQLFQRSLQPTTSNELKPTKIRTKQTNITNNMIKITSNDFYYTWKACFLPLLAIKWHFGISNTWDEMYEISSTHRSILQTKKLTSVLN